MRVIKFRGKRKDNGEWAYGSLTIEYDGTCHINYWVDKLLEPENNYREPVHEMAEVVPETVGQFTGLKDRKKVDIYEGDRVNDLVDECIVVWDQREAKFCLEIVNYEEVISVRQTHKPMPLDAIRLIVIGNIHDVNPASGQSGVNNMLNDPNAKQAEQEAAANAEATNAQESAQQDQATGATQDSEEGSTEG